MKTLYIGTFALPALAHIDLAQTYEPMGPEGILRSVSGRAIKQMTYDKLRIITSATGWIPSGLQSLNFANQHILRCIVPEVMPCVFATRQVTLPSGKYRADVGHEPFGFAQMASGETLRATVTLVGDVATVASAAGAVAYMVGFYPQRTVYLTRPTRTVLSWELIAEEV